MNLCVDNGGDNMLIKFELKTEEDNFKHDELSLSRYDLLSNIYIKNINEYIAKFNQEYKIQYCLYYNPHTNKKEYLYIVLLTMNDNHNITIIDENLSHRSVKIDDLISFNHKSNSIILFYDLSKASIFLKGLIFNWTNDIPKLNLKKNSISDIKHFLYCLRSAIILRMNKNNTLNTIVEWNKKFIDTIDNINNIKTNKKSVMEFAKEIFSGIEDKINTKNKS